MFSLNYATLIDPLLKDMRTCITGYSEIKANCRVLDVCCGTGDQVFHFADRGAAAVGIDENADMLKLAEENKGKKRADNADFILANASNLPFPDKSFDCASLSLALHEMQRMQRDKTIAEMRRVVKKGGILIFADFVIPMPCNFIGYCIRAVEFFAGSDNYRCFKDYGEYGGLIRLLSENGLIPDNEAILLSGNLHVVKTHNQ